MKGTEFEVSQIISCVSTRQRRPTDIRKFLKLQEEIGDSEECARLFVLYEKEMPRKQEQAYQRRTKKKVSDEECISSESPLIRMRES